jgi:hypothetical protein
MSGMDAFQRPFSTFMTAWKMVSAMTPLALMVSNSTSPVSTLVSFRIFWAAMRRGFPTCPPVGSKYSRMSWLKLSRQAE